VALAMLFLAGCTQAPPSIVGRWSGKLDNPAAEIPSEALLKSPATPEATTALKPDINSLNKQQLQKVAFEYVFHADGLMRMQTTTPHTETVTKATWREAAPDGGWRIIEIRPRGHQIVTGQLKIRFLDADRFQMQSQLHGQRTSTFTRAPDLELTGR